MFKRSLTHHTRFMAVALLAAVVSAAQAAAPEILKQIPGDAYGVVVLNNPRTVANKVSNAATRLQLTLPPDLLGTATRAIGITVGFDANGSAALVLLKPGPEHAGKPYFSDTENPPAILLIPTTKAALMTEKFNPTKPDKDGISEVTLPQDPEEKYYMTVVEEKWVALAMKKEDMARYVARGAAFAKTASAETLKVFENNDLILWGNVEKLGAGVDKWLDEQHTNLAGMRNLTNFIDGGDALASTLEKHALDMVFDLGKRYFQDAGAGMLTVRLTDSGATLGLISDFKAGTPLGKFVAAQAGGGVSLKGLPAGNYLLAASGRWNNDAVAGVVGDFLDGILKDPALSNDKRLPEMRKTMDAAKQVMQLTKGMSFTLLEPARGKDGVFNGAFLLESSDPKKLMEMQLQNTGNTILQEGMSPDLKTTVTVTPNALTVKDVPLAKMNVKITLREETPDKPITLASRQGFETVQRIYGPNGMTVYMGVVGKRVLMIYGSDLALLESAVTAAQADTDALSAMPEIAATKDQLVANPVAVMYLPLARWVNMAQTLAMPGVEAPPAAANVKGAPVVMSLGVSGTMVTAEIHVPITAIIATQEAVAQLERATQGQTPPGQILPDLP